MNQDKRYWIALNLIPGIGSVAYRKLIDAFKDPSRVFESPRRGLEGIEGVGPKLALAIKEFPLKSRLKNELGRIKDLGVSVLTYRDSTYPKNLLAIYDPPPVLYVRGRLEAKDDLAVAIVGSRMATRHGKALTERLARDLAARGVTVVSGMARGIDSAAHRGALLGRGRTIAVLGCGVDVVYPPEGRALMREIIGKGAVISEFPMGMRPHSSNFPRRNRIISGLAVGVVVVEATRQSGSLITANYALDQGREVFAVPGNVGFPSSQGTNRLIKDGAKLVERVEDVLEEIAPECRERSEMGRDRGDGQTPALSEEEQLIYSLLGEEPVHIDHLITQTQWDVGRVSQVLLDLELAGLISQLAGKHFVRV
ncbi:MAG: DNA-protecting protein DprA [Proteobacteria bacterium]|nr:DNA-protecting protein DprA [Pseudomonadota bacterium]